MRTTITLDDGLYALLKGEAEAKDTSLSRVISEALREALHARRSRAEAAPPLRLVTYGQGGLLPGRSWQALREVEAEDDRLRLGIAGDDDGLS